MKDFHDVSALSTLFAFDGQGLADAVVACFQRRGTAWIPEVPDVLTSAFYQDSAFQERWTYYLRGGTLREAPSARFEEIGERVRRFLLPVRDAIVSARPFKMRWHPGGPWE